MRGALSSQDRDGPFGLRGATAPPVRSARGVRRSTTVPGSAEDVWAVLADFGALAAWVPMVQHSCLLSEQTEDVGTVRRVQIARLTLVERVITWDPPSTLAYDVEGLPPVVVGARNTWRITSTGGRSEVELVTEIDAGLNPLKRLAARKVADRMALASELMLAGLASRLGETAAATAPRTKEAP